MRTLLITLLAGLALAACNTRPCRELSEGRVSESRATLVCRPAGAPPLVAGVPFELQTAPGYDSTCSVAVDVDAGRLSVRITTMNEWSSRCDFFGRPSAAEEPEGLRFPPPPVKCSVPALSAGLYILDTYEPQSFSIPATADGGVDDGGFQRVGLPECSD